MNYFLSGMAFLVFGLLLVVFGILVMLSERFLHYLMSTIWKENEKFMSTGEQRIYNKYITGLESIGIGLLLIIVSFIMFLS